MKKEVSFNIIENLLNTYSYIENDKGERISLQCDQSDWADDCGNPSIYIFKNQKENAYCYPRNLKDISKDIDGLNSKLESMDEDDKEMQKFLKEQGVNFLYFKMAEAQGYFIITKTNDPSEATGLFYTKHEALILEDVCSQLERYLMGENVEICLHTKDGADEVAWGISIYDVGKILVRDYNVNPELKKIVTPTIYRNIA